MCSGEARDNATGMMSVMLYDHGDRKGNTRLTLADSAVMKMSKDKSYITFRMFDGVNYRRPTQNRTGHRSVQKIHFSKQEMVIP